MAQDKRKLLLDVFDPIDDYDEYASWWDNAPDVGSLPRSGFCVRDKEGMVACMFLARTDCDFTIITFWYDRPEASARDKYIAYSMMIDACKQMTVKMGRKQIFIYTTVSGIIKILKRHGFKNNNGHLRWSE